MDFSSLKGKAAAEEITKIKQLLMRVNEVRAFI